MPNPSDDAPSTSSRHKRERSTRYPGVSLAESLKLCESIDRLGLDGLAASEIASALGYKNIKTNTFSARLSAARQFGLVNLTGKGYALTSSAREILHPVNPQDLPRLHRQALLKPPLYAELAERLEGRRVPDAEILGNVLYHNHQIIASAKRTAADAFLESARFAGALGTDQVFLPGGPVASQPSEQGSTASKLRGVPSARTKPPGVRIELPLWDHDQGKVIRVRAPASISASSFERFLQAFRLHVKIEDGPSSDTSE